MFKEVQVLNVIYIIFYRWFFFYKL